MIVDGFYVDENNPEDPDGWGFSKWELVGESIGLLVNNFLKHGHDVVVNGYIDEPAWVELQKCSVLDYKVLLLPTVDKVIERDAGRNQDVQMGEPTVRKHYAFFSQDAFFDDFIKIDSSQQTVDQTVADIIEIIGRSR